MATELQEIFPQLSTMNFPAAYTDCCLDWLPLCVDTDCPIFKDWLSLPANTSFHSGLDWLPFPANTDTPSFPSSLLQLSSLSFSAVKMLTESVWPIFHYAVIFSSWRLLGGWASYFGMMIQCDFDLRINVSHSGYISWPSDFEDC